MLNLPEKEMTRGIYSCLDAIYPFEIAQRQMEDIEEFPEKLKEFYNFQIHELTPVILKIASRGVRIDLEKKEKLYNELLKLSEEVEKKMSWVVGEEFNSRSNPQVKNLFKNLLKIRTVKAKSGNDTFGSEAMTIYREENPLLEPLMTLLLEYRSINVFLSTFLGAKVSEDGRMRTSYNVAGTAFYRLSSKKDGFKEGLNFQNVPSKGKIDLKHSFEEDDEFSKILAGDIYGKTELPNCKTIFIPDEGYTFFDVDYCLTEDHEILTEKGWVNIKEFVENKLAVKIACWDAMEGSVSWDNPIAYIEKPYQGDIYSFEGKTSLKGTGKHRQPMISNYGKFSCKRFSDLYNSKNANNRYIHSTYTKGTGNIKVNLTYLKLLAAMQADGCFHQNHIKFTFKKQRKIRRLKELLKELGVSFNERIVQGYGHTVIYIPTKEPIIQELHKDLGNTKTFPNWLLQLDSYAINILVQELRYWDGKNEKLANFSYFSTNYKNILIVQALCCLCGKYSTISVSCKKGYKNCYSLYISDKTTSQDRCTKRTKESFTGITYCVTSKTNYIVVRRNGKVTITGNSGADAMVVAWDSNCAWLKNFFLTSKIKLYQFLASEYLQREVSADEKWYGLFKRFTHGSNYGMGAEKAGASCGMPAKEARRIQKFYFKLCPEIPAWHKKIENSVKTKGYVENVFGARMYFIDKKDPTWLNKAISAIPQSTIAIMVNKGIVSIEREEEEKAQVLMQVHDSAAGQFLTLDKTAKERIMKHMSIPIYNETLTIPAEIKTSEISYGDCK